MSKEWKKIELKEVKKYRVPSKSKKGEFWIVIEYSNGTFDCTCPAYKKECRHTRIVKWWKKEVVGNPEKCFYTHNPCNLEEHHLMRGVNRRFSLTVWLTGWIHKMATNEKEFEEHLIYLFMTMDKPEKIYFKAKIKEISIKFLVSGDKGIRVLLLADDIEESAKLGKLEPEDLIWVRASGEIKFKAMVKSVKKRVSKEIEKMNILLEVAPGELVEAVAFVGLPIDTELEVEYKKI